MTSITGGRRRGVLASLRKQWLVNASLVYLAVMVLCAVFGPLLLGHVAGNQRLVQRLLPPFNLSHGFFDILGTDALGQSILARLIVGAQLTFIVVLAAVGISVVVGFCVGLISSYFGGWVDLVIMRIADVLMTIPTLLLALAVLYLFEGSVGMLIVVLAVTNLPIMIRATRAQGLEVRLRTFVDAARAMGAGRLNIIFSQMAIVVAPTVLTIALLEFSVIMIEVAGLSYLGVGLQPPAIAWGIMVADGQQYLTAAWWLTVFPGLIITLTAVALLLVSNYLRSLSDPLQSSSMQGAPRVRRGDAPSDVAGLG
jgi:peptide/nickel transport system permease protein